MPSREPELYKDKIEVSLDGRQIFYLFFGGAVIVGLVFVLGVLVGRRVEARGHLDRAETQAETDPLAALDRLERSDRLSFHGALRGSEAATDVEKAIGEIEKRRVQADKKPDKRPEADKKVEDKKPEDKKVEDKKPEDKKVEDKKVEDRKLDDRKPEDKKADDKRADADKKPEADKHLEAARKPDDKRAEPDKKADEPVTRPDADKPRSDKKAEGGAGGEKKLRKHDDAAAESKPARRDGDKEAHAEPRSDGDPRSSENKQRFTLQLSSFQDKSEAEAFLSSTRSAGYQPYLVEADVSGKGTFYRVRLGSYRTIDAANDAKAEYEKAAKKTAQVMRL